MIFVKTDENDNILSMFETDDMEAVTLNGYTESDQCTRRIVQIHDGTYKFANKTTPSDFLPTLDEVKNTKLLELKEFRDIEEIAPIQTDKGLFDYDDKARDRINAAIIALDGGGSISWTLANNTNVDVTADDLRNVIRAVAVRSNILHVKYRGLHELVDNAATSEEVLVITWNTEIN